MYDPQSVKSNTNNPQSIKSMRYDLQSDRLTNVSDLNDETSHYQKLASVLHVKTFF